jgi:3-hexulose-6-phosphate synthase
MKLQLALDTLDIVKAKSLLTTIGDTIDIVEIGTPFIIRDGVQAITQIKKAFPALTVLADVKIMDAGDHEASLAFDAGADIVTVLGVSHRMTIEHVIKTAGRYARQVMVDMISVNDVATRASEIDTMGADYICVHTAFDVQGQNQNPRQELECVKKIVKHAKTAVAGGINEKTLPTLVPLRPDVVIVGGAIVNHQDPKKTADIMKKLLKKST